MVNFSKQFEGQLIPEWKEAFVDYCQLKKDLKKINLPNYNTTSSGNYQATSNFLKTIFSHLMRLFGHQDRDNRVIKVHTKLASSVSAGDVHTTEVLEQFGETDGANEFFACLDLQLNKVNQFYKMKEEEFLDRGESLKKQLEVLTELKSEFKQRRGKGATSQDSKEDASISCTFSCDEDSVRSKTEQDQRPPHDNTSEINEPQDELEKPMTADREESKTRTLQDAFINGQVKKLRIKIPLTNPSRTLSAISYLVWEDLMNRTSWKCGPEGDTKKLHVNRTKLHHAEKMIKRAFIELYKGLGYLKTYRNLNMMAFVKILKKFDKLTNRQVLPIYLSVVETSYFNSSDKVMKLADEAEDLFVKHLTDEDRRKAVKYLRPQQHKESHAVTFFIGLFTGCFIVLFAGYVIMAHIDGKYKRNADTVYMETVYQVLSMFSLLFLHLFLYGCNIFLWRKARINYRFIFEMAPTEGLKNRDVFLICTTSMTVVTGAVLAHLSLQAKGQSSQIQAVPGLLLLLFMVMLVFPFNTIYQSSRYCFLRVIRNIILSPLYKVVMLDFFMADQLCSQVPMLRNLEHTVCYYMTGSYKTQDYGYCVRTENYRDLAYVVSFLPYYWRAMQCARRWFDEGQTTHVVNLGKYVSAMLAAGARVAYEKDGSVGWLFLLVTMSSVATVYQLYWDYVKDWGLLQPASKNPWLRNELMLRHKFIYFFSMGLNLILRLAWLQTILHLSFGGVDFRVTELFLAGLEVIRRGQWNFYRLENEHLNNAGKFRAVKTVPLPFHEVDEED